MNSINSDDENKFVLDFFKNNTNNDFIWIGAKKVGSNFEWNNMNAFNYTNWDSGQPNNTDGKEVYLTMHSNGVWHDWDGSHGGSHQFICEKIIIFD
jgi:hypothetical protein